AAWQAAASEHAECSAGLAASSERRELLRYQLHELEALAPRPGELAELEEEHRRLAHADELLAGLQALVLRLYAADEDSLHDLLARAGRELAELQALDPALAPAARTLDESLILLREGVDTLRERADGIDLDPARLAQVEQRIAALLEAGRKYRVAPETLPELLAQVAQQLGDDDDPDARSARLAAALEQARARYAELAGELGRRRAQAASGLAEAVSAGMQQLGMPGGRLVVELLPLAGTAGSAAGDERVQYLVASNPGQPALPLAQFASGGELSRISLAIQSVTAAGLEVVTQVYDEVDVGVGGRVAEIVGRRLRELAASRQVLCITHLPQVAALAHHHLQVTKSSSGQATRTEVAALDRSARVQELARMLGGLQITAQTRAHAEEMLELAAG
ncbi:MAG TPA: DNA repair protein RecN, partial [Gammaproteobacteria bacterium]